MTVSEFRALSKWAREFFEKRAHIADVNGRELTFYLDDLFNIRKINTGKALHLLKHCI